MVELILELMGQPRTPTTTSPTAPGHDLRYAIDAHQAARRARLDAQIPTSPPGLAATVEWYRDQRGLVAPAEAADRGQVRADGSVSMADLRIEPTPVPGLLVVHLPVHGDNRGWFKENWQREQMIELGLPDFAPVQNNVSYNGRRGYDARHPRGALGQDGLRRHGPDLRRMGGPACRRDLRTVFTLELGPETAVFVPRGVGNSYQTLEDATSYSYLVNDHWSPEARSSYTFVNLADPALAISWPIPLEDSDVRRARQKSRFPRDVRNR